jgi:hypothetical protein
VQPSEVRATQIPADVEQDYKAEAAAAAVAIALSMRQSAPQKPEMAAASARGRLCCAPVSCLSVRTALIANNEGLSDEIARENTKPNV